MNGQNSPRGVCLELRVLLLAAALVALWPWPAGALDAHARFDGVWVIQGGSLDPNSVHHATPENEPIPPMTPAYAQRYKDNVAAMRRGDANGDPTTRCLPPGMPRLMNMPYTMEVLVVPREVVLIGEWMTQARHIYTDGRKHPDDLDPSYNGHSIGHWQGDALVVDTVGLRADTETDRRGVMHSGQLQLTERIRLLDVNTLQDLITVTDPVAFTRPWSYTRTFVRRPGMEQREYVCEENNINPFTKEGESK